MPWEEKTVLTMREDYVRAVLQGEESKSALCRAYGISRKTGDKWLARALEGGSLSDQSRAPNKIANKTTPDVEALIVDARGDHPYWGARKLKRYLENKGYEDLPCKSTFENILKRNDLIEPETSAAHKPMRRFVHEKPNDLWQMDFKGDVGMLDGNRCYPLTILDDHSRFSPCVQACSGVGSEEFWPRIIKVFQEYGLPKMILCDNGKPWGDSKSGNITTFDVWMMQLDILPMHIRPRHPQTQGKDERLNGTLKRELLSRVLIEDLADAQNKCDPWRYEYNYERPHESLNMDVPAKHYTASKRPYVEQPSEPEYDSGMRLRKVNYKGYISINEHRYYLTEALIGKYLSLKDITQDRVVLCYGNYEVAKIDLDQRLIISKRIYRNQNSR